MSLFPTLVRAGALAAVAWGYADALALALGGGAQRAFLAGAAVLGALALGRGRARGQRLGLLLVPLGGLLVPRLAPWLGPLPLPFATLLALLLALPLLGLGALARDLLEHPRAPRDAILPGILLGLGLPLRFGLGPLGWLAACALTAIGPRPRAEDSRAAAAPPPPAAGSEGVGQVLAGFMLGLGLPVVVALLELYDGASALQDLRRLLGLGLPAVLAGWLFAGLAATRWRAIAAALAVAATAAGIGLAFAAVDRFEDPRLFNSVVADPRFARFAQDGPRLGEDDAFYVPYLALRLAGVAAVAAGALARMVLGSRGGGSRLLLGAALGLAALAFGAGAAAPPLLLSAALGASLALALGGTRRTLDVRIRLAAAAVIGGALVPLLPGPLWPRTSVPFFDNLETQVAVAGGGPARRFTGSTIVRLLERSATGAAPAGSAVAPERFLADGRNFLAPARAADAGLAEEARFLVALADGAAPRRALLAGPPHAGTLEAWRAAGVEGLALAVDPPALAELAARDESWPALGRLPVSATIASARGRFDLILVRDEATWQRRRNPFRAESLAAAAARLAPGGRCAVALDPERLEPGVLGGVAAALRASFPRVELWLVPRGWHCPRLLLAGAAAPTAAAVSPLLLLAADAELEALPAAGARGPLAPIVPRLAAAEFRRPDRGRATARAARALAALREALPARAAETLLPFCEEVLAGQVYDVRDDYEQAPASEWLDLEEGSLRTLLELTRRHPADPFLRSFWAELAPLLIEKREAEWIHRDLAPLVAEGTTEWPDGAAAGLGWQEPALLLAVGQAWLEMLLPEEALASADRILAVAPAHADGLLLRARALAALSQHADALAAFAAAATALHPARPLALLRDWAEAALAAGDSRLTLELARELRREFGDGALSRPLRRLFGLGEQESVHLLPGLDDEAGG